jgi:hypothetical protein
MYKTRLAIYRLLLISLIFACAPVQANSVRIFSLSADNWARPRTGAVLPQMEPVRLAVSYWESLNDAAMMLSYPGEDSGELWAAELKDWLISLGVPSDYIHLSPGLQSGGELRIVVGPTQELEL